FRTRKQARRSPGIITGAARHSPAPLRLRDSRGALYAIRGTQGGLPNCRPQRPDKIGCPQSSRVSLRRSGKRSAVASPLGLGFGKGTFSKLVRRPGTQNSAYLQPIEPDRDIRPCPPPRDTPASLV